MTFTEASRFQKFIFRLTILTICVIISSLYLLVLFAFYESSYLIAKTWIAVSMIFLLIIGCIVFARLKLNLLTIFVASFFASILFPLFWLILPIKVHQSYVGLRLKDEDGYIVQDRYCLSSCEEVSRLKTVGYLVERKFYSWRYAELLKRVSVENACCISRPFDSKYFFATLLVLELTFEYLPVIFVLALILLLYERYNRVDIRVFGEEFLKSNHDVRKINALGVLLLCVIVLYNLAYQNNLDA